MLRYTSRFFKNLNRLFYGTRAEPRAKKNSASIIVKQLEEKNLPDSPQAKAEDKRWEHQYKDMQLCYQRLSTTCTVLTTIFSGGTLSVLWGNYRINQEVSRKSLEKMQTELAKMKAEIDKTKTQQQKHELQEAKRHDNNNHHLLHKGHVFKLRK